MREVFIHQSKLKNVRLLVYIEMEKEFNLYLLKIFHIYSVLQGPHKVRVNVMVTFLPDGF